MQALRDLRERGGGFAAAGETASAANSELAALAGETLAGRFRHWRGASGRRYVFSVYDSDACPAYDDAVLIVATIGPSGERRIVSIADTGALPEIAVAHARRIASSLSMRVECHVHLLAASRFEREAAIADLRPFRPA